MNTLLTSHAWQVAAWTMLHFLWIGTAIALVGMLLHFLLARLSRQRPGLRYAAALFTLAVFTVAPLGIAWHLSLQTKSTPEVTLVEAESLTDPILPPQELSEPSEPLVIDLAETPLHTPPIEASPSSFDEQVTNVPSDSLHAVLDDPTNQQSATSVSRPTTEFLAPRALQLVTYLPWLWLVGAPLTFALLTTGLVGSAKLRRTAKPLDALGKAGDTLEQTLGRLAKTLAISRKIAVGVSDSLAQPILIGIFRPLILLPSAALSNCTPEELEMILLHELTHVRRWDNLVNLMQRVIESLLFFHPCVWWLSRQVRIDREQCVDAAVVDRTAKPQAYAELLVNFAAARNQLPPTLAASAMARHPLAGRVRKILNLEDEPMLVKRSTATLAGLAVLVVLSLLVWQPTLESVAKETKPKRVAQFSELSRENEANEEKKRTQSDAAGLATDEKSKSTQPESPKRRYDAHFINDVKTYPPGVPLQRINEELVATISEEYKFSITENEDGSITVQRRPKKPEPVDPSKYTAKQWRGIFKPNHDSLMVTIGYSLDYKLRRELELRFQVFVKESGIGVAEWVRSTDIKWGPHDESVTIAAPRFAHVMYFEPEIEALMHKGPPAPAVSNPPSTTNHPPGFEVEQIVDSKMPMQQLAKLIEQYEADGFEVSVKKLNEDQLVLRRVAKEKKPANSPFPTLEEQRAADLVYKLLKVEVEKLSEEELKRVKAKKFAGGLKVTSAHFPGQYGATKGPLQPGDLLVGLHVWPTTSLADIQTIFERDDIDELSPLKFYVIRQELRPTEEERKRQKERARKNRGGYGAGEFGGEYGGPPEPEMEAVDVLITGRIEPNLEAWRTIQQRREANQAQQESSPIAGLTRQQSTDLRRQVAALKQQRAASQIRHNAFAKLLAASNPKERSTRALEQSELLQNEMDQLDAVIEKISSRGNIQSLAERRQESQREHEMMAKESLVAQLNRARAEQKASLEAWRNVKESLDPKVLEETVKPELRKKYFESKAKVAQLEKQLGINKSPQQPQPTYLYAGKPFEHWRDLFKYELSTERRIEAIKALAAFGRTGKHEEAVNAIMEVMAQYDAHRVTDLEEQLLIQASSAIWRLPESIWLPRLEDLFAEKPKAWSWFVVASAEHRLQAEFQEPFEQMLLQTAREAESRDHVEALKHYLRRYPTMEHEQTAELVGQAQRLFRQQLDTRLLYSMANVKGAGPVLVRLTESVNEKVVTMTRFSLDRMKSSQATEEVRAHMFAQLKNPESEKDLLNAIRNLAALGNSANSAFNDLKDIIESAALLEAQVAAAFAMQRISNGAARAFELIKQEGNFPSEGKVTDAMIQQLIKAEEKAVFGGSAG